METKRICPSCQKTLPPDVPLGLCPECLIKSGFNTGTEPGNPGKESSFVPPPVERLRTLFPQLEILELIGKGGMGAVYKARQLALDRLVALKVLPPGAADDAGFAERFNREARALARLNHPHIVAVHDFGQAGGQPYLVMEFVDGPNLRQVEQAGRLTPEQALEIVPQICEALQFAHNEGVVHRDIKPENILLDKKGRVKITDFGIAKIVGVPAGKVSLTGAKDVLGTPHYMAPEQVEKPATVDHRADIYSLGVVFYELLTGELPLGRFQPPSKKVQMDVRLDEVVLHALEKEPERRYQQASQVKTDVETIAHAAIPEGRIPKAVAPPHFSGLAVVGACLAPLFFASMFFWDFGHLGGLPAARGMIISSLGFMAILGTTLLGWISVAQIRRSEGRLNGLGLALFDGLLLPILALDIFLVFALGFANKVVNIAWLAHWYPALSEHAFLTMWHFLIWLLIASGVIIGLDYVIIRAVWRTRLSRGTLPEIPPDSEPVESRLMPATIHSLVKAPANWLVATGILNWIAIPLILFVTMGIVAGKIGTVVALPTLLIPLSVMILSSVIIVAGLKMKRLEAYPLAIIGSVLAILVTPGNLIGLPVGIWSLVVLCRREVREAFGKDYLPFGATAPQPSGGNGGAWKVTAVIVAAVMILLAIPVGALLLAIAIPNFIKARDRARAVAEMQASPPLTAMAVRFGPVREVTLNDLDDRNGNEALSFATGQVISLFGDFGRQSAEGRIIWLNSNRVDLLVDYARGRWALMTRSMKFRDLPNEKWDSPHVEFGGDWPESAVLEKRERRGDTFYLLPTNSQPPLTFAFQTSAGSHGVLQIAGFTENPRGVKIRYKLTQLAGGGGGGSVAAAGQNAQRKFVRLVVGDTAMTFEGQPTSWEGVGALLAKVPDRNKTVLEFAVTSGQITVSQQNEWFQKASALARQHGLEYASFIGIHPLGSKGTSSSSAQSVPSFAPAAFGPVMTQPVSGATISNLIATENWAEMMKLFPQAIRRTDKANTVESDIRMGVPILLEWDMSLPMAFVTGMEKRPMPEFKPGCWLEFPPDRDRVIVHLRHDPWPHAAWRFHLEILDDGGTTVQQLDHTLENTGRRPPKRQWTDEQSEFSGALGRGVLDRGKRFRLSVESLWTEQDGEFQPGVELPLYFGLSTVDYTGMFRAEWLKVDATNAEAVVRARVAEWPKAKWNLALELFDRDGQPAGDGQTVAENGGWIVSRVAMGEREFRFPVKNLGSGTRAPQRFRLRVEAVSDAPKRADADVRSPSSSSTDHPTNQPTAKKLALSESSAGGFMAITPIKKVKAWQDVRFKDLSGIDYSTRTELPATLWFNQKTIWPATMPAGVEPQTILSNAMNPGLGIRQLHRDGITGKGVNVAIIDQPLYPDHPEFVGKIAAYHDVGCQSESSMHGPAVASLLVGNNCGTAPDARLYYVAAPSWSEDAAFQAEALDWLVEQNRALPANEKIRVVSVSTAPSGPESPFKTNKETWDAACARAENDGLLVLDCTSHRGFIGPCYLDAADPESVSKCKPGFPSQQAMWGGSRRSWVLVPCSPRTTAEEYVKGEFGYQHCGEGGLSWSIPYCAGVLALGWQLRPDLDATQMRELLFKSAHQIGDGLLIINPPELIRRVKALPVAGEK